MADICPPTSPPTTTTTVSTFERACRHAKTLRNLSSDQQLELYALYKQSQHGPCDIAKPAFWDFTGKAKWQSWKALGDVSASEAEERYVELVKQLDTSWNELAGDDENDQQSTPKQGGGGGGAASGFGVSVSTMSRSDSDTDMDDDQKTVFDWCRCGRLDKIKEIFETTANATKAIESALTNSPEEGGMNLLHCAADLGHLDIVRYLINSLAMSPFDVNVRDGEGQTVLHYAVSCSHLDTVKFLVSVGGELTLKDEEGMTPLDLVDEGDCDMRVALMKR